MEIKLGSVYTNKTKRYVLPTLKEYGETFEEKFTNLFKLAIGIGDYTLIELGMVVEHNIFVLIDTKFARISFKQTLNWIKSQEYYETDYPFDDIHSGHLHMLVIKIPERFKESTKEFEKGNYTKMYEMKDLNKYFAGRKKELDVFSRDPEELEKFVDRINELFNTDMDSTKWTGEIDLPMKEKEEYFNTELYKT